MDVTLHNPLSSSILLHRLDTLQDGSELTCIAARDILLPPFANVTSRLYLIPNSCGKMTIRGIRVCLFAWIQCVGSYWKCLEYCLLQFSLQFSDFRSGSDSLFPQTSDYCLCTTAERYKRRFAHDGADIAMYGGTDRRLNDPNQDDSRREKWKRLDF